MLPLLAAMLAEHHAEIVEVGVDWVRENSDDLRGRRPRHETVALVEREFEVYRALILRGDRGPRDAFIEHVTSLRAAMKFNISTLVRGFLCFRHGVMHVLDHHERVSMRQRVELLELLDDAYLETILVMTDVYTDKLKGALRSAQRELLHKEKMAALGGLVAGVAHEINTPVGVAITASSLLADRVAAIQEKFDDKTLRRRDMKRFLADAREASALTSTNLQRAGELIVSFKKVAVDQSNAKRRRFELGAYVRDVLTSLGPLYKRSPHAVRLEVEGELEVNTHAGAISQIVTNLLSNAIVHAFPEGFAGEVVLRVGAGASGRAVIEAADNGRGISPELRRRVFEPFFTTNRGSGGSGLGLHIIHNLVTELLGGEITLESTLGAGTTVRISFPVQAPG